MIVKLVILALALSTLLLTGCSYMTYEGKPDGSTTASGFELGTKTALSGAKFSTDSKGARSLSIDSLSADQVEGLKQMNQGLSLMLEGLAKGAMKGVAP
jgi:outer membrane murein-binding lipoprotein Lpp